MGHCRVWHYCDLGLQRQHRLTLVISQQEIMEWQCELLVSSSRGANTIAGVKQNIGHMSDGSSSHCAGALKLGLKKAFELKKKWKGQPVYEYGVTPSDPVSEQIGSHKKKKGKRR